MNESTAIDVLRVDNESRATQEILTEVMKELSSKLFVSTTKATDKLFPHGINLVYAKVKVFDVEVEVKVSGVPEPSIVSAQ